MANRASFLCAERRLDRRVAAVATRLPELQGEPISIDWRRGLQDRRGAVHGASFLRQRSMSFDCTAAEFPRIFVHELFHFVWARAGNPLRWRYEDLVRGELRAKARGELGWSAEWRKDALGPRDVRRRTRAWRDYCCESFCDTAAWMYSSAGRHPEFTLAARFRPKRREWFRRELGGGPLSI